MINNFSKIRIVNAGDREMEGKVLKKLLERKCENVEVSISLDADRKGMWHNFKNAINVEDEGNWLIALEDDVSFPVDVLQRMDYILDFAPKDAWIFFYVPTNKAMKEAFNSGKKVNKSRYNYWSQCVCIPKTSRNHFIETIDDIWPPENIGGDSRTKKYMEVNQKEAFTILPSLFQHLGTWRSSAGYAGKIGENVRQSFCYDPNFDVYSVDWKKEFETPFKDKTPKGLIGFDGWKPNDKLDKWNKLNGMRL
jgi:hypothetical protein